jgi:hypothetical protein
VSQVEARTAAKRLISGLPLAAELSQWLKPGHAVPIGGYSLDRLAEALPGWVAVAGAARRSTALERPRRILVIGYLRWWLEYACALGLLLAGLGHSVEVGFLPYQRWALPVEPFDIRRQRIYMRRLLGRLSPLVRVLDLGTGRLRTLPHALEEDLEALSRIDVQYTLMREILDLSAGTPDSELMALRRRRNRAAACAVYEQLSQGAYDAVLVPNGSVLEFGAIFRTARHLGVPVVTFEFGEQRDRMWLAQNAEVMRLDMSDLWRARGADALTESEMAAIQTLEQARRGSKPWANFGRLWQAAESQGAQAARGQLSLDPERPVALLCTNVVADSLALGCELFTEGMAGWLALTVRHFAQHPEAQLVVRVHPGELLGAGHTSVDIVQGTLPQLPPHVMLIPPESPLNTYDLMELAHFGLTYTTTAGLEMVMNGVPVVVSGNTHYRGKGFTHDPASVQEYLGTLDRLLKEPRGHRLDPHLVELAWRYAYLFFFEYPLPFPWHVEHFWEDIAGVPLEAMFNPSRGLTYQAALDGLVGLPIDWGRLAQAGRAP